MVKGYQYSVYTIGFIIDDTKITSNHRKLNCHWGYNNQKMGGIMSNAADFVLYKL